MTIRFDEDTARFQEMLAGAFEAFATTQDVLRDTVKRLKAQEPVSSAEVVKQIKDMNGALLLALGLEGKVRDATGQRQAGAGAGELDLEAARAEIGGRLARLRAAREGGELSQGAE
jgi:hypothetical protein